MAKIFVRERSRTGEGDEKPRFAIIAVHDIDLDFIARHVRKYEIEAIAKETEAEVIYLKHENKKDDDEKSEDKRRKKRRNR